MFVYVLTALSCIGGFLFGYDTGVISGALVLIEEDFVMSDFQKELVVGITVGGAMLSAFAAGIEPCSMVIN
jgi:SP family myo-inositol transporter-like MFS transporter 13